VYATAAFARGAVAAPWLSTLPDHAGVLVAEDGRVTVTPVLRRKRVCGRGPGATLAS
jgi:hypothetical protein